MRVIFTLLSLSAIALAQTASVTGRVTDPSGAVVPGVKVTVESIETSIATTTETNQEGFYSVPQLVPGRYNLTANKQGFVPLRQTNLTLAVQQIARLDLTLQVGSVSETVEVSAQAVLLDSESSTVGQVIGNRQVMELPLLGRNPYALAMLVPGVRPSAGSNNLPIDQISTVPYMINGQRASANEFLLDGAPNTAASQNQAVVNANPDAVQEFKVETNNFSAEYGRAAGGVFNVVTKSGANELHFSLYEFLRNEKLNANDFFANRAGLPKPPFKFNQFGGTLSGPVSIPKVYNGRNRTFLFASTEIVRFVQGITFTGTVPRPEQLAGDFRNARNAAGTVVTVYDPATTSANPTGTGFIRTPFANNLVPANRIDTVARRVIPFFPAPNAAGNPVTGVNNFVRVDGNRVIKDTFSLRGDHLFSERNRMFIRYSYDDTPFIRAAPYGRDNPASPGTGAQIFNRQNAVLEDTHTITPTTLLTLRYSFTRLGNRREPFSDGFDLTTLGLPANLQPQIGEPRAFPYVSITGFSVTGSIPNIVVGGALGAGDLIRLGNNSHALQGNVTKSLTRHTLKTGAEYRLIQFNNQQTGSNAVLFDFTPQWTQGPNPAASSATAGLSLATFLLGVPGGSVTPAPPLAQSQRYYGVFIQDDWKVSNRLTLNLGFRWEYETPRYDRFNQLTNFDFAAGGLTFVGVGGLPRFNAEPDRNNFAPRAGLAFKLSNKTVLRTGGGVFFTSSTGIGTGGGAFGTSGFQASTQIVTSLDGVTPVVSWSNPYPQGLVQPSGSSLGLRTLLGQNVAFFNRGNRQPYSGQWNANLQRELPRGLFYEIGYAASRGLKLPETRQFNQLPDSALAQGDGLRQLVPNPYFGQIEVGTLAQRTVARAQLLRPYPQFTAVTSQNEHWASSSYHAFQTKLEKRFTGGVSFLASYTWSHLDDYGIGTFAGETLSGQNFQNWNNLAAEWAPSVADQTHRWIVNAVYELPWLRTRRDAAGKILGGWEIAGIWMRFSGGPLGVTSAVNNTFSQGGNQRPNWNGTLPSVTSPTPELWLDRSVFSIPASYAFGNAPRTLRDVRADRTSQVDVVFSKNTRFRERFNLQFRAEFFNIANTPRFDPPNVVFGNAQFGGVSAQGNQPRIIQFALKLMR